MLDRDGEPFVDPEDDVLVGMLVTVGGEVVHPAVRAALDRQIESARSGGEAGA
jgi:hypothetical protein